MEPELERIRSKVAFLTSRFPYPIEKGDKLRLYHQIKTLSKTFDIYLFAIGEGTTNKADFEQVLPLIKELHFFKLDYFSRIYSLISGLFSGIPMQVLFFFNHKIQKKITASLAAIQPDHVFCQLARMAPYARNLPYPKTLDFMDAFGFGMEKRANVAGGLLRMVYWREAKLMKAYEKSLTTDFDHFTIISEQDKKYMEFAQVDCDMIVLPNGIDPS
ncbi:MAG: hypothetical protein WAT79_00330, partial [Saprospiraceae bacterium]